MTRQLARSILLIVWATLIAGGVVAYLATRSVLLADLDAALIARARSLPELTGTTEAAPRLEEAAGDRYVLSNHLGQTRGRLAESSKDAPLPAILNSSLAALGDGHRVRSLTLRFTPRDGGAPVTLIYSGSAERFDRVLRHLAIALTVFGLAAGAAAAGVAVGVSHAALRPLRGTADAIVQINERQLDRRIDASALPEELQPLASRLNDMLQRLEQAFSQRKQFLADASHELRTPVAALVTTIEVALRRPREASELTRVLRTCLSDAQMLQQLVQTLLVHARAESRAGQQSAETFDALELLTQCADVADGLALVKDVTLRRFLPPTMEIHSRPALLRGIVMNLLGNAVEYNRAGGSVELRAEMNGADLELAVIDNGQGIPPKDLPHIFQPFYRAGGPARGNEGPDDKQHLGLGLYLVDSHIKALGGECKVQSDPGAGTTFHIRLPDVAVSEPSVLEGATV
jgi:signal transduction histidine kinase